MQQPCGAPLQTRQVPRERRPTQFSSGRRPASTRLATLLSGAAQNNVRPPNMPPYHLTDSAELSRMIREMAKGVPEVVASSTVGIVGSREKVIRQIGTGTLLSVADHRFVVTAGHVIRKARDDELTVGVSGADDGHFLTATHPWWISGSINRPQTEDAHDIAVYEFSSEQLKRIAGASFVRIADVEFERDLSRGYFLVSGFPVMWSSTLTEINPEAPMTTKLLQYGTWTLQGAVTGLDDYDPETHFLLETKPATLLNPEGKAAVFRTNSGHPADMPQDFQGVSGCSVWMIANLAKSPDTWKKSPARLVGVETGIYRKRSAIKVTRWNAVTTLLYNCRPSLRNVLALYANL